ncbi:hypothetical protein AJ80_04537 [Polytolypa hystricis UAMH7299]|uniref:Letm1 RBD domain-containing protein n=1 Tax=Polytolypa hystricis (strain UAMH7299) TaxID=1447883 RepID=A0A2B7YAD0_POLH7|nr:hypothetical protein AJ80_04537 [Polytolypa hystricis UAMH7299]
MRAAILARNAASTQRIAAARGRISGNLSAYSLASARLNRRHLPPHLQALAILVPQQRGYATGPSTSSTPGGPSFPPPGFNAAQAKKPLPRAQPSAEASKTTTPSTTAGRASAHNETAPAANGSVAEGKPFSTEVKPAKGSDVEPVEKEAKKLTIGQKIKKEVQHYWDGTKLLAAEVNISTKLALKMAAGYELSRRENRQLQRTVQDLARLVPFSVFIIIPFAELLLPIALKLFPNLLPSTYEAQKSKEAKAATLRGTRKEVSSFLQNTLKETGLPVSATNAKKEEFTEFFRKVRATGESPSQDDVITVCKIFKDDITLDNLSRPQLVAMCKYMSLNSFGTDAMLRYHIRHRMRQIKRDDKAISFEGVDSLLVPELQMACASRGLRTHGMSPARLRDDLSMWLELRLRKGVPSTLLVLSTAYMYTQQSSQEYEIDSQIDALQAVLSSIPEELFHEIELEVHNAEGAATNKQRLEVIREQQELIEEENEQNTENEAEGVSAPKDDVNIDEEKVEASSSSEGTASEAQAAEASESEKDQAAQKENQEKN